MFVPILNKTIQTTVTLSTQKARLIGIALLSIATLSIFAISEGIRAMLISYDLTMLYISFVVGFILFTPLVSVVLHPFTKQPQQSDRREFRSTLLANIGLVLFVQCLFFLIWMTDAIAVYSIYVDQTSFLSQTFNIAGENKGEFSREFVIFNVFLGLFFSAISIVVGVVPCLFARIDNKGIIGNFIASFSFFKRTKLHLAWYALLITCSVLLPLMFIKYIFLISFPYALYIVTTKLSEQIMHN